MCLFPYANRNEKSKAYFYGITQFECGGCPECLSKKSRNWALRASMEARSSPSMMITLTYDTYKYDKKGNIIGENLPQDLAVDKRDCQNFIKRLRAKFPDKQIKYLLSAEYGKPRFGCPRGRAHYHALIFGLVFDDIYQYKRSKRGNIIYRSPTLEKIWQGGKERKGGICTVDSVNCSARIARYCTKYCAKDSGAHDTFMLFSRNIGVDNLLSSFNGVSYWIDGREYPVPRTIWQKVIETRYNIHGYSRYVNFPKPVNGYIKSAPLVKYFNQCQLRDLYAKTRDADPQYRAYISYWREKARIIDITRPSVLSRILALPNDKYRTYKDQAMKTLIRVENLDPYIPPRSNSRANAFRGSLSYVARFAKSFAENPPCHNTANDRICKRVVTKTSRVVLLKAQKWEKGEKNPFSM